MIAPGIKQTLDRVLRPFDIVLIDGLVLMLRNVPLAHPLTDACVGKVGLVIPGCAIGQA